MHYNRWRKSGDPGGPEPIIKFRKAGEPRECLTCHRVKPFADFLADSRCPGQGLSRCRTCRSVARKIESRFSRYGITEAEYRAMLDSQGGGCAVCSGTIRLCVDHDHATGRVRGILCNGCNIALARLNDDPDQIERLADYVRR